MKKILFILISTFLSVQVLGQTTLLNENFDGASYGSITEVSGPPYYWIDNGTGTGCNDWVVTNNLVNVPCSGCDQERAGIEYGSSSCSSNGVLVVGPFTPSVSCVDISFDYGFGEGSSAPTTGSDFYVGLYDGSGSLVTTLIANTETEVDGSYSQQICGLTGGTSYTIRVRFRDDWINWGVMVDNFLVTENGTSANTIIYTESQNCASDLSYTVDVTITDLNGNSAANIYVDNTLYLSGVGVGTYTTPSISGGSIVKIESADDVAVFSNEIYSSCDVCSLTSKPSDLPCDAPSVDLTQPFVGSTSCGYSATLGGTDRGPDNFVPGTSENDSWLKFTAADDTVRLEWETEITASCSNGVQYAIFSGSCFDEDAMTQLGDMYNPTGANEGLTSGKFEVTGLTPGEEYFIYIDGYAGQQCDYSWSPADGVAISNPNDECANAIELNCSGEEVLGNNILATATGAPSTPCVGSSGVGVWYKITGTGGDITLTTDFVGTNFDTQINVFDGSCGSLNCVAGDDDSGTTVANSSTVIFTSVNGTEYWIYVDGDGAAKGEFILSASCTSCPASVGTWN